MRNLIFCLTLLSALWNNTFSQKTYYVSNSEKIIDGFSHKYSTISGGDTISIEAGIRELLLIKNLIGSRENPIVIINKKSQVVFESTNNYAISIRSSAFLKLTGSGSQNHKYGFYIKSLQNVNSNGISIEAMSSDIEIEFFEISNCGFAGIMAKTSPSCENNARRNRFIQRNTILHDNYIHDVGGEGFYIGSSFYKGKKLNNCKGQPTVLPHTLSGVRIYNNIIERTGLDGIQVSSATSNCEIFGNIIRDDSRKEKKGQMSGIILGGGSKCDCYNNKIFNGKGTGILVFGLGNQKIYNNLIVNPGKDYQPNDINLRQYGILITDNTVEKDSSFFILNNTIINSKSDGIRITSEKSKGNIIYNNIIVNPGSYKQYNNDKTSYKGIDAFIFRPNSKIEFDTSHNIFSLNIKKLGFQENDNENYQLSESSGLIDFGRDISDFNIEIDLNNKKRKQGLGYDIGAFESGYSDKSKFPKNYNFQIVLSDEKEDKLKVSVLHDDFMIIKLFDAFGNEIEIIRNSYTLRGTHLFKIKTELNNYRIVFAQLQIRKKTYKKLIYVK